MNICKDKLIASDGTYKLNWQGLPLVLAGTIDQAKEFHPTAFMLTKRETGKDFGFFFKALKEGIKIIFDTEYEPDTLLADSSGAITNGFKIGFGYKPTYRITCWVHAVRAFDYKYSSNLSSEIKKELDMIYLSYKLLHLLVFIKN